MMIYIITDTENHFHNELYTITNRIYFTRNNSDLSVTKLTFSSTHAHTTKREMEKCKQTKKRMTQNNNFQLNNEKCTNKLWAIASWAAGEMR